MDRTILQLTGMQSTKFGGMERYFLELTRQCRERGLGTHIQYESLPFQSGYERSLRAAGAEVLVEPVPRVALAAFKTLRALVAKTRPFVIHTHFLPNNILPVVWTVGRMFGVRRHVSMVHNLSSSKRALKNKIAFLGCNHVLGVSDAVTNDLRDRGVSSRRVQTHYMGLIDTPSFTTQARAELRSELGIPMDVPVFGAIAFDAPFKGVDVLLEAFRYVLRECPTAHLVQLGVDPARSRLVTANKDVTNVHWLGIVDNASHYLSAVDVYIQPSRSSEGLPLALMEAMALRRPVVATRVSGNVEAVVDGVSGILVEPEDPRSLANAMLELGNDPASTERCNQMGDAGYTRFRELFDGRKSVAKLIESYYINP